jgi:hypothetical protein
MVRVNKRKKMHHIRREAMNKIHYVLSNEVRGVQQARSFKNYFENKLPLPTHHENIIAPTSAPIDVNAGIIPSLCENDTGCLGFNNSKWRNNESWRNVFQNTNSLPHAAQSTRHLFGNVDYLGADTTTPFSIDHNKMSSRRIKHLVKIA